MNSLIKNKLLDKIFKSLKNINIVLLIMTLALGIFGGNIIFSKSVKANGDASVWDGKTVDRSFFDYDDNILEISSAAEFLGLADMCKKGFDFSNYTIKLLVDIDINGQKWSPIENFSGTLDGNNHVIKNANIIANNEIGNGIFSAFNKKTTIKNLNFENIEVLCGNTLFNKVAIIVGVNKAFGTEIINCNINNCYIGRVENFTNSLYLAFVTCMSEASIKVENVNITNSMANGGSNGYTAGVVYSINHDKYASVIKNVNIINSYLIATGNSVYLFNGKGNNNTIVSECYSNMWPVQLGIDVVAPYVSEKIVEEYNKIYDKYNKLTYEYFLTVGQTNNVGSILYEVILDENDIYADIINNPNYVTTKNATNCVFNFGLEVDVEVVHNGVKTTSKTKQLVIDFKEGFNAVKVKASLNGINVADVKLLTNLDLLLEAQNENGEALTSLSNFLKKSELNYSLDSFGTATYYLAVKNVPEFITIKSNGAEVASNSKIPYTAVDEFDKKVAYSIVVDGDLIDLESHLVVAKDNVFTKVDDVTYDICNAKGVKYEGVSLLLNETYPWSFGSYNGTTYIYSSNQGEDSTSSYVVFEIASGKTISFIYACSSENNWDYLYFDANGTVTNTKGKNNDHTNLDEFFTDNAKWTEYTFANTTSDKVLLKVYYKKDSSSKGGLDTAYIKNITVTNNNAPKSRGKMTNSTSDYGTLYDTNVYYKYEDERKFVLDETTRVFTTVADEAKNASVTFTITDTDIFYFEYDDTTYEANKVTAIFDGKEILLSGDGNNGDYNYKSFAYNFDTVGTHTIKIMFTYYAWYACSIRNVQALKATDHSVKVTTIGEGSVYDIYGFVKEAMNTENTYKTFNEFQLNAETLPQSNWEYVGYKIKKADGTYGELISQNNDFIRVTTDIEICVVFKEKINIQNEIQYSVLKNGVEISNASVVNYDEIILTEILTDTQMIYQVNDIQGYSVKVNDNGKELPLLSDKGKYFYTLSDFSQSHEIDFIYTDDEAKDTIIKLYINLIPDINKYLILPESKPIELINDTTYPLIFSNKKSTDGKFAYVTTNSNMDKTTSGAAFKVKGSGVIIFDYFVSSEANANRYSTADSGDKLLYGINTVLEFGKVLSSDWESYGHVLPEYANLVGYAGANLQETNTSLAQGETGWQKGIIPVSGAEDEETIVYIGYVKDGYSRDRDDMAGIANVGFISANFEFSYETNSSTTTITAKIDDVEIPSGSTVAAGKKAILTATNTNTSEKFYGWVDQDGRILSRQTTLTYNLSKSLNVKAIFITENSKIMCNNLFYATLEEALNATASASEVFIRILADMEISNDITINENVTILLPFELDDTEGMKIGTANVKRPSWGRGIKPYVTLTVSENATVTINGKLIVGGVQHAPNQASQGMTSGAYAKLVNNGSLIINGKMDVRGLVVGSGVLTLNDGAILKEPFMVDNYSGGTNTSDLYGANQFPFVQFATANIQCQKIVNYGSKILGTTSLYFWSSIHTQDVVLVDKIENRTASSEGSLIWLHEGSSLVITYDGKAVNHGYNTVHLGDSGLNIVEVNGVITAGEFSLQGYGSSEMTLSIPYTYNFIINADAKVILEKYYKLMPGSIIEIKENGTIEIAKKGGLLVYNGLLQAPKSGKEYPSSSILKANGFSQIGILINNGTLDVKGLFLGIIQTTSNTGTIIVAEDADVAPKIITDGAGGGYTDNRSIFELKAEINGLYGRIPLENGKTYKAYNDDEFILEKYIMSYYSGNSGSSTYHPNVEVVINELLKGRFLEFKDGKYYSDVEFYIGEEIENISIEIAGNIYKTNALGKFIANVAVDEIYYKSLSDFYNHYASVVMNDLTILDEVVKTIELQNTNNYELVYDEVGSTIKPLDIKALVTFYQGKTEVIDLAPSIDNTKYVTLNAELSSSKYLVNLTHDIYVSSMEVAIYKNNYNMLKSSNDLINDAVKLYEELAALKENRTAKETEYLMQIISEYLDYIEIVPAKITVTTVPYGATKADAVLTFLDGTKKNAVVANITYIVNSNGIKADFVYDVDYYDAKDILVCDTNNVTAVDVKIIIDDKMSTYGDELLELSATANLLNNDTIKDVVDLIKEDGTKPGSYAITAIKKHPGYNIIVENGTYEITKRKIDVAVLNHKDIMKASATKISDIEISVSGNIDDNYEFSYELYQNNIYITSIDKLGNVLDILDIGTYKIKPIISSEYYEIENITLGEITILIDNTYYDVEVTFTSNGVELLLPSKVYDGIEVIPNIKVVKHDTKEEVVDGISYTLTGKDTSVIKKAGIYTINVTVNEVEYQNKATFEVERREIMVDITTKELVYNGAIQNPLFVVTSKIETDDVDVITKATTNVNVGNYFVETLGLTGADAENYILKTQEIREYTIVKKQIIVEITKVEQVYGDTDTILGAKSLTEIPSADTLNAIIKLTREKGDIVGSYDIIGEVVNDNYQVEFINGADAYVITKRNATVLIDDKNSIYGESLVELTGTIQGLAEKDESVDVKSIYRLYKEDGLDANTYLIKGEVVNQNYHITFVNGIYTIEKRAILIEVPNETSVYGDMIKEVVPTVISGTLKENEELSEILEVLKETGLDAREYKLIVNTKSNNYNIRVSYTNGDYSIYTITPRAIEVTINDLTINNKTSYADLMSQLSYVISSGTLCENDDLNLTMYVIMNGKTITQENYHKHLCGGIHKITGTAANSNYNVTIVDAMLEVIKPQVRVVNIITNYTYTGEIFEGFDYTKNIEGYLESATASAFKAWYYRSGDASKTEVELRNAGTYIMVVEIVHKTSYEFEKDSQTEFEITIAKKDISDNIIIEGIEKENYININTITKPIVSLKETIDLNIEQKLYKDNTLVELIEGLGKYKFVVTIIDDNYEGEKIVEFEVIENIAETINKLKHGRLELERKRGLEIIEYSTRLKEKIDALSGVELLLISNNSEYQNLVEDIRNRYTELNVMFKSVTEKEKELMEKYPEITDTSYDTKYQIYAFIASLDEIGQSFITSENLLKLTAVKEEVSSVLEKSFVKVSSLEALLEKINRYNKAAVLQDAHAVVITLTVEEKGLALLDQRQAKILHDYEELWTDYVASLENVYTVSNKTLNAQIVISVIMVMTMVSAMAVILKRERF